MGDMGDYWRDVKAAKRLAKASAEDWNRLYPVGTPVVVTKDRGEKIETKTRSAAQLGGGGVAVIFLEGISGYYLLDRVRPLPDRVAAEATGDFYCEGEQVRSSLKCQRPCDDCWKAFTRSATTSIAKEGK